ELREGIDYSIMFYGGKLLSHLTFEAELFTNNLIQLMRINRSCYVVIDKDRVAKPNMTKKRICEEIGVGIFLITKSTEIENYLTKRTLDQWLISKQKVALENDISQPDKIEDLILRKNPRFD